MRENCRDVGLISHASRRVEHILRKTILKSPLYAPPQSLSIHSRSAVDTSADMTFAPDIHFYSYSQIQHRTRGVE